MSRAPSPNRSEFFGGLLLGCSPMLLIVLFGMCAGVSSFTLSSRLRDETTPVTLPTIDEQTPVAGLLPTRSAAKKSPVYVGDDLSCVTELMLEAATVASTEEWRSKKGATTAVALHLNAREEDGFLKALLATRPDLAGVPFSMGKACRTTGDRAKAFKAAASSVQENTGAALLADVKDPDAAGDKRQRFYEAHLAVVAQVMHAGDTSAQKTLVRGLSAIPRPEATNALARVAVFSTDEAVRACAIEALSVRREEEATTMLVAGLRYPWPAVAENAARAIVKLERKDLIPYLEAVLAAPDPRGPRVEVLAGKEETVAHELVRVNHLRNCMLCHAPAERGKTPDETLIAEVPIPTEPLPRERYGQSDSPLLVRIDVTYLRQDFSAMQTVTDWSARTWENKQRFDFLVRKRVLTPAEAADLRSRLAGASPYRRAASMALTELKGGDPEANGTGQVSGKHSPGAVAMRADEPRKAIGSCEGADFGGSEPDR